MSEKVSTILGAFVWLFLMSLMCWSATKEPAPTKYTLIDREAVMRLTSAELARNTAEINKRMTGQARGGK